MKAFLNLIRWPNLLIIILTMVLMRYAVIEPLLSKIDVILLHGSGEGTFMTLQFPLFQFILLVAATLLITSAGYVINDYFDIRTDLINRGEVIVGTKITRRKAMMWHTIFNITGVGAGFYISWKAGYFWLGTLYLIVSGLLYFYSASYKRQFLVGNLLVALLTALVPLLVVFYEWPALYRYYMLNAVTLPDFNLIFYWVGGFAVFAFLLTLAREIIKDIEDFEGDKAHGRNTVPVVTGIMGARIIAASINIVITALLFIVWYFAINDRITLIYLVLFIALPLLYVVYQLLISRHSEQLHIASRYMKLAMFTGILYSLVVKAILTWNLF
ncbi:MAG: geranylgeranylglycerol-phosphate geranylgeranyltransferase [Bacteroidales bacterium]|nr:geranylgeranylglycerol-phosphate geranylgeranyltransferase [Bacteroidales bacterium]